MENIKKEYNKKQKIKLARLSNIFIYFILSLKITISLFIIVIQYLYNSFYFCKILHKYRKQENMY